MRIPVYENQTRTPNAPQFSAMADMRISGNLGALADGLENYQKIRQAELDEAQKTEWYKADNGFKMDVLRARTDMINSIQNGGAYADAETKFQKTFDAAKAKYAPFFASDENMAQRQAVEFERAGLEGLLSIREAVQRRRKGDAVASANIRAQDVSERLLRAKIDGNQIEVAKLTSEMSSIYAGATAVGAVQADAAKLRIKETMSEMNAQHALYVAESDPDAGLATLEGYYKSGDISAENYIRLRGPMVEKVDRQNIAYDQAAAIYGDSSRAPLSTVPSRPPKPVKVTQDGVDAVYSGVLQKFSSGEQFDQAGFESAVIDLSVRSNFLPTTIADQAAAYLNLDPATAKPEAIANAASMARIVSNVDQYGLPVKMNLDKDAILKANLFTQRMNAGLTAEEAFKRTFAVTSTEDARIAFVEARKEATKLFMGSAVDDKKFDFGDIPASQFARSEFKSLYAEYRGIGASVSEAMKKAKDEINASYLKFNGVITRDPITNYLTGIKEDDIVSTAGNFYTQVTGQPLASNERLVVVADSIAKTQMTKGEKPDFVVMMSIDKFEPVPVINPKTGRPLRMRLENEKIEYIKKTSVSDPVATPLSVEDAMAGMFRRKTIKEEKIK
jgi:hypothetical protein